ncbi:cupin domain-containing protein [Mesorhizobium sp. RMAD-H1]|uniref:cupin domain-containing protein n=1 Tax=Mesorhizobium sp. RMAD-H1 TaxID=2587065 RepID=UPI001610EF70|nr:cupin domain-containing protein [Mesorhizobium sp. RMAD-H1]MBB2972984.1 mannose-6-phosphate isomerase-like protein (cupin superfamily) [Mesorhizobium sp. RMAD-H1]
MGKAVLCLSPDGGRTYRLGTMTAIFKADEDETDGHYSVSEWWLEPNTTGPGAHAHEANDELFYVIEGTASILAGDKWLEAPKGTFLRIPAGITHDFENRTSARVGLLNVFIPGGFERNMPAIVEWFKNNPGPPC